jgi:hypothetical protein
MRKKDIERLERLLTRKGGDVCRVYVRKLGTLPVALRLVRMAQPGEIATWQRSKATSWSELRRLNRGNHHVLVVGLTVKYTGCGYSGDGFEFQEISDTGTDTPFLLPLTQIEDCINVYQSTRDYLNLHYERKSAQLRAEREASAKLVAQRQSEQEHVRLTAARLNTLIEQHAHLPQRHVVPILDRYGSAARLAVDHELLSALTDHLEAALALNVRPAQKEQVSA